MGELVDKTASSLAIVEKKPQRPGGCVGIFFQLFDWNRRFAKKKLFSKKLLPPGRLKQAAKKFRGDESKLRLIADENSGGFPNSKKNNVDLDRRQDTRTPSLVARLMGLESMPTLQREKSKKVRIFNYGSDKADKFVDNIQENSKKDELDVEKGGGKNELRPQKLQKTGCPEKQQQVARFGAEILPFTNALTKSRKNQHPKLPVPPPVKSPRNFSRRNASKLIGAAATRILEPGLQTSRSKYALTYSNTSRNPPREEMTDNLGYSTRVISELKPPCRNCGNSFDESNQKRCFDKNLPVFVPPPSRFPGFSYQESEKMMGHSTYYEEFEEEFPMNNLRPFSEQMPQYFSGKRNKPQKDLSMSSLRSNRKSQNSNHMSRTEMMPPRSKFNALPNETNFGSFSRSVNGSTRPQVSSSRMDCKFQMEKKVNSRQNELVRKRRPTSNVSKQTENSVLTSSIDDKQIYGPMNDMSADQVDNNVISFSFNSRAKPKSEVSAVEKGRVQIGSSTYSGKPKFDPLCGDDLGLLLKQKLRELNSQGDDIGGIAPKKTTAIILQELIAALTSEVPFQLNNFHKQSVSDSRHLSSPKSFISSKANEIAVKQPLERDHSSPGSVLEAYFSNNDSCRSSSLDDNSETLDSATSITTMSNKDIVAAILDNVSEALCSVNLDLKGNKFEHAKEVLLSSELMLQNATHSDSVDQRGFSVSNFFHDEITTLATVLWMNFGSSIGMEDRKEVNQLKRFAFDSTIEYLEMMFERLYKSGSKISTKLPQHMSTNMLIFDVVGEVRKWEQFSQLFHDELIEVEMSLSFGEWTRFEPDMFGTSMEISDNVLEFVLDEILMDLCSC